MGAPGPAVNSQDIVAKTPMSLVAMARLALGVRQRKCACERCCTSAMELCAAFRTFIRWKFTAPLRSSPRREPQAGRRRDRGGCCRALVLASMGMLIRGQRRASPSTPFQIVDTRRSPGRRPCSPPGLHAYLPRTPMLPGLPSLAPPSRPLVFPSSRPPNQNTP